jgi:Flp pilus assembly protein TadG
MLDVLTKRSRESQLDRSRARRRGSKQKGATMLETALVLLTMLGIIVFILDMGRILLLQQFITVRAQTAARQAAVNNWTASDVQNFTVYNSTTAPDGSPSGFLGLTTSEVSYTTAGTSGTPNYRVKVTVSGVQVLTMIPYIAGQYTLPPIVATAPAQSLGATN